MGWGRKRFVFQYLYIFSINIHQKKPNLKEPLDTKYRQQDNLSLSSCYSLLSLLVAILSSVNFTYKNLQASLTAVTTRSFLKYLHADSQILDLKNMMQRSWDFSFISVFSNLAH